MKATIKDVAKLADVSISTVSRVLNAPDKVVPDKRERVLRAIEELKYYPNALARGLIYKRTQTIGVLIPDVSNLFFAEVFRGMEDAARESGIHLIICNTDGEKERMMETIKVLKQRQIDGLIFTSEPVFPLYYQIFQKVNLPVVLAATHSPEYNIPSVKVDDDIASYDATQYLIQKGHRKIAMISGWSTDPIAGLPRMQGFIKAMMDHHMELNRDRQLEFGDYRFDDGYAAMQRLLEKFPEVTAVFAASDEMAIGAITYLHQQGIHVPNHVSVIGYDNTRLAKMYIPKLTTVAQPLYEIGFIAIKKLEELLEKGKLDESRTVLAHKIMERESVKSIVPVSR